MGDELSELLLRDRQALVREVLAAVQAQLPEYRELPAEALRGDISTVIETTLLQFVEILRTGELPDAAALSALRESAARRAEEGVSVEAVLAAYHLGIEVVWDRFADRPAEELIRSNRFLLRFLRLVTAAVTAGYLEERQIMFGDEHAARQAVLAALLDGAPAGDVAARGGFRLPVAYEVLAVAIDRHPDEETPGIDARVAARRKVRRVRAELDRRSREPVLAALSDEGGLALVPAGGEAVPALVHELGRVAGAGVRAAAVLAEPPAVAAAARTAREVLDVVLAGHHPPGLYRLDDVLLEFHLSRPSTAAPALAALLDPLAERPELLETLSCWLRTGQNRRRTASELHLHPNTVDYRLRKVAELTGLDPQQHLITIETAMAIRALPASRGPQHRESRSPAP